MSFYGSVINYIAKTFNKIKIGNSIIQAKRHDEQLELDSDSWIALTPEVDNNKIIISHNAPQEIVDHCLLNINNNDISTINIGNENNPNGAQITMQLPTFDEKGHKAGLEELSIDININDEIFRTQQLRTEFDLEVKRSVEEDSRLDEEIKKETKRAETEEKKLNERIGYPAEGDSMSSGVYAYIDETKAAILGEGISDTFDTLVEIQDWINGPGVNATELTKAIANEAGMREHSDNALNTKIENTNEKITSLTGRVSANESKIKNTINVNEEQQAQLNSHNSILANDIPAIYETKNDANAKLTEAKEYSDDKIAALRYTSSQNATRYISSISQENGIINPVYQNLPFQTPNSIFLTYEEEAGQLIFPSYFRVETPENTPAVVYVYDGGEI